MPDTAPAARARCPRRAARAIPSALLMVVVWAAPDARAATTDDDLARRTFANAEQLLREGKIEQALRDFEQVYTAYPDSGLADDALYRIGVHYYPIEKVDALGTASEEAIAKAREIFQKINSKYSREDNAPRALLKLGLIALDPTNPSRSVDEAYASFSSVVNIYPDSDVVDRALFGAGYADFVARKYAKAIGSFERVAEEYPRGTSADEARFYLGMALTRRGSFIPALEEFQSIRSSHPGGPLADRALDRLTQIYKMKMQPGLGPRPLFTQDLAYAPAIDPNVSRAEVMLAVDGLSVLHTLDARTGAIARLGHDGKLLSTGPPLPGAVEIAVDDAGVETLAAGDRIRLGVDLILPTRQDGGAPRPLERIGAAVRLGLRDIALLDEDHNEVLLYSGDAARLKLLYRDPEGKARLMGLALGAESCLYTIDRRARRIIEIAADATPKPVVPVPEAADLLQDPVALAADDLGDLFVLDRRSRAVAIMTREGKLVEKIVSQPGTPSDFTYASAIAVGPRGEIYIHDAKRRTILRFW